MADTLTDFVTILKRRVRIEDVIGETVQLERAAGGHGFVRGSRRGTGEHSLVVNLDKQVYYWNSNSEYSPSEKYQDVIAWVMVRDRTDFWHACETLARKAGIEMPKMDSAQSARFAAVRKQEDALGIAQEVFTKWLWADERALAYARGRGWTDATIKEAGLGFTGYGKPSEYEEMKLALAAAVDINSPAAVAILGKRGGVKAWAATHGVTLNPKWEESDRIPSLLGWSDKFGLIYPSIEFGRVTYFFRRHLKLNADESALVGSDEPKSYNLPKELVGERKVFRNHMYAPKIERLVFVEGPADAVTLGQWEAQRRDLIQQYRNEGKDAGWLEQIPAFGAVAIAGTSWKDHAETIREEIKSGDHEAIYIGLDGDKAGSASVRGKRGEFPVVEYFGAMTRIVEWGDKDANDWLKAMAGKAIEEQLQEVSRAMGKAMPLAVHVARWAGTQTDAQLTEKALGRMAQVLNQLGEQTLQAYMVELLEALKPLGERMNSMTKLLRLLKKSADTTEGDDDLIEQVIMGGWFPDDETENSGYLIDIFYDKKAEWTRFAVAHIKDLSRNEREIYTADEVVIGKTKYVPLMDENIKWGTIILPTGLGDEKTTSEIIRFNEKFVRKHFLMDEASRYKLSATYALFTWVYDCFDALNFLRAMGGSGSGKSDLMYLIGLLSYRLMVTLSVSSTAAYKGLAHLYKGTLFVDEAQDLMKKDDGTMRALLKGRATKRYSNVVNMMEVQSPSGKTYAPSTAQVYGPTLITMYGAFDDAGIENRCVSFSLSQKDMIELDRVGIEPGYYPPELDEMAEEGRNMALHWRLKMWKPKIELTPEQRAAHKLSDPLVSPRVNQVMRPMKVLAVMEGDFDLLEELKTIGQANYEDEMIKRAGSFEAMILRAYIAAFERDGYADKLKNGRMGRLGQVRHILYKDLAQIANEILDAENLADGVTDDKKKSSIKSKTIGDICRDTFRFPVGRTGDGWAVAFDADRLEIGKLRFGLNREQAEVEAGGEADSPEVEVVVNFPKKSAIQQAWMGDGPQAGSFDEETGEWRL